MKKFLFFLIPILLIGCDQALQWLEGEEYSSQIVMGSKTNSDHFSLVFSGNINGETHPCGCRHFPLGGLPQVYGLFSELKSKKQFIYVDAGDTFFDSITLSDFQRESKIFNARKLVESLNTLGLSYFVPGDQDFAAGNKIFLELMSDAKFALLAANFKPPKNLKTPINWKPWVKHKIGPKTIYLVGIVDPQMLREGGSLFSNPQTALENAMKSIKADGYKSKNKRQHLILISSGGHSFDKRVLNLHPEFNWVLGAHNQNFNKTPENVGKTQMVQVLSRNHYMGEIKFSFAETPSKEFQENQYYVHEVRDELGKLVKENPFYEFLDKLKADLKVIQEKEESKISSAFESSAPLLTANSCIGCHQEQADKWHQTDHSIAYMTLIRVNEEKKGECIECHSLKFREAFNKTSEIVLFEQKPNNEKLNNYWKAFKSKFAPYPVVRELATEKVSKISKAWLRFDDQQEATHQYANVQCLNCHDQRPEHPFEINKSQLSKAARKEKIKINCLNCHTPDQSPEWYEKTGNKRLNEQVFDTHYQEIACPSLNKQLEE